MEKCPVEKGDIFYASWGYDQTNYDFVIIKEVSKTCKSVKAQMAKREEVGHTEQADIQKPLSEGYGDIFRLKVKDFHGQPTLRGSYPFIDGKMETDKRRDFFWKHEEDRTYYETNPASGH